MAQTFREAVRAVAGLDLVEARADVDLGIRVAVPHRDGVGIDRLLCAAAVFAAGGGPAVVVDLGTALTVDLVSRDGMFLGGTIAPGLRLCLDALHLKTSLLPRVDLSPPASVLGTNTPDCIRSGVVYGAAGMVEGLVRRVAACAGGPARTVLTGGDAAFLSPYLTFPHELDPHLVLRGLLLAHQRNTASNTNL
jgi:type III pantothenate kinase